MRVGVVSVHVVCFDGVATLGLGHVQPRADDGREQIDPSYVEPSFVGVTYVGRPQNNDRKS